jgi:hypothetical protein
LRIELYRQAGTRGLADHERRGTKCLIRERSEVDGLKLCKSSGAAKVVIRKSSRVCGLGWL